MSNDWIPIGADRNMGSWLVLWARETADGWEFRCGKVGYSHVEMGTPGRVNASGETE